MKIAEMEMPETQPAPQPQSNRVKHLEALLEEALEVVEDLEEEEREIDDCSMNRLRALAKISGALYRALDRVDSL